ncbi:MAG: hypothetical protein EAZ31_00405, partial [Cytophagia bacterium]
HLTGSNSTTDPAILLSSIVQNTSTSLLDLDTYTDYQIINTRSSDPVALKTGYSLNACLRNAGSSCFSDTDCAPNDLISTKVRSVSDWGAFANNLAEQSFWKENLTCGNPEPKVLFSKEIVLKSGFIR